MSDNTLILEFYIYEINSFQIYCNFLWIQELSNLSCEATKSDKVLSTNGLSFFNNGTNDGWY